MAKCIFNYFSIFYLFIHLIGCSEDTGTVQTYFGGKIINPKTKFIVLCSNDKIIDTLRLNNRNKFLGTYNNLDEGLYYFKHGNENQYIYLEPRDSLMLRLNTWNFDESLVFAGTGAERNNILIDIFLEDENERKLFFDFNKLAPTRYQSKIDSLISERLLTFNEYKTNHPKETQEYFNILKTTLTYPIYARAERYPINHVYTSKLNKFPKINNSFYQYRATIKYNNDALMYYTPYAQYITNYLYNLTYSLGHKPMMNDFSSEFTIDLLKTIDLEINSEISKNAFLKRTVLDHFQRKSSCNVNQEAFDVFFSLSSNREDKRLLKNLLKDNSSLHKGDTLQDFTILDFTNQNVSIHELTKNKNSVLLFWRKEYISKSFMNSRIPFLQDKYPLLNFAIIEIDGDNTNRIGNIDIKNQYFIHSKNLNTNFLTSKMHRTVLVDKNGIIENGYAAISSRNIYKQLAALSKIN